MQYNTLRPSTEGEKLFSFVPIARKLLNLNMQRSAHMPKCPGPKEQSATGVKCDICHRTFETERAISAGKGGKPRYTKLKEIERGEPSPATPSKRIWRGLDKRRYRCNDPAGTPL
jgi:hypothetical protein